MDTINTNNGTPMNTLKRETRNIFRLSNLGIFTWIVLNILLIWTILSGGQYASAGWAAGVAQADLRSWTALPKRVLVRSLPRPADGVLRLMGDDRPLAEIRVPEGNSLVFVRKPARPAAPSVKIVTLP